MRIGSHLLYIAAALLLTLLFSSCKKEVPESTPGKAMDAADADGALGALGDPTREMRGVYIATVYDLDFPSKAGLDADTLKSELDSIVDDVERLGFNAIFFQVRGSCDAMYKSSIFPVSEYLTGVTGGELPGGFDPLSYLIEIAHARDIDVHAWVNPLRVTRGSPSRPKTDVTALAANSPARLHPEYTVEYAGELYFDAGMPEVRELIADGVREIIDGYDVDGILFDDYFYPYPEDGYEFDDSATYEKYSGGRELGDFRRESVNEMVRLVYETVKAADERCRFGIAPFGIWRNDNGENGGSATRGLESYDEIYCDTLAWVKGGYVDYVAPQLYWSFSRESAPYGVLADWWDEQVRGTGVDLYISHAAYKYGEDEWSFAHAVHELTEQVKHARPLISYRGSIMYSLSSLRENASGVADDIEAAYFRSVSYFKKDGGKYTYYGE